MHSFWHGFVFPHILAVLISFETVTSGTGVVCCCSLYPEGFDAISPTVDNAVAMKENFPMSSLALFATNSPHYKSTLAQVVIRANAAYNDFLKSEEGHCFSGQVSLWLDCSQLLHIEINCFM